jgi:superfamily II DNA or RNA helicase
VNKIIILDNKKCRIISEDTDLLKRLHRYLSFKLAGVEYMPSYQNGWNGITYLLSKSNKFNYGLLSKVESFLKDRNVVYTIEDRRPPKNIHAELNIEENLIKHKLIPRDHQIKICQAAYSGDRGIIRAATGSGKAQPLDAKVLTPFGWKLMAEIKVGSLVIGSDGKSKEVLDIFPQGQKDIYKITFSDDSITECCNDHLWLTSTFNERSHGKTTKKIRTLSEIKDTLYRYDGSSNHAIQMVKPVEFNSQNILIDPYLLGLLLGDGCFSNKTGVSISNADNEIIEYCKDSVISYNLVLKQHGKYDYYLVNKTKRAFQKNNLISDLKHYDLMCKLSYDKFIPKQYLFNSVQVRLSILQGLMDTDGFISSNGASNIFYTTSPQLAKDVQFIIQSLGGKAVIKDKKTKYTYKNIKKQGRDSFAVYISLPNDIQPFRIGKKLSRFKNKTKYIPTRYIRSIEYVGKKEAQCILIDSEDHLYITDDFIVTHNTLCTALITAKINKPTIIYVIGLDLLDQFYKLYCKLFDEPIGYIGNGICNIERINIASIWTIGRALKLDTKDIIDDDDGTNEKELDENNRVKIIKLLNETKLHIFDESHVVTTNTISEIYKNIDPEYIYGFSGTPFRDDNSDLLINSILGEQIIDVSASELINKGLLAAPLIKFYTVPKMPVSSTYPAVYKEYIVENSTRNNMIASLAKELVDKKYTPLVLFKQIRHGDILFELLQEAGIKCEMLYGNDSLDRRNEVKDKLIKKEINLILASTIFDLGLDLPELNALILCGGGKSSIRTLQRIGRVIRAHKGKKFAAVADFYDQVKFLKKHSMIRYKVYSSELGFKVFKSKEMK